MNHDSMIEVIAAHRDGKEIEARLRDFEVHWNPCQVSGTFFNFRLYEYRIKPAPPKPREWWIGLHPFTNRAHGQASACIDVHEGRNRPDGCDSNDLVHVIEVLPSTGEEGTRITISDNQVLAWLGRWRSEIPHKAVSSLQDILGVPEGKPPVPAPTPCPPSGIMATGGYP